MTETSGVSVLVTALSSFLFAVLGVDYYAMLWATIGAVTTLLWSSPTRKIEGAITMLVSALIGAALGSFVNDQVLHSRSFLLVTSLVGGAGAQPLVKSLVSGAVTWLDRKAGNPPKEKS